MGYYIGLAGMVAGFFGWATYPNWIGALRDSEYRGGGGGW